MPTSNANECVFVPLGGAGEIGMNMYLYGYGRQDARQWLIVDLGLTFPGPGEPGVDVILPDIGFAVEERRNVAGLVLTHAHEDHFGAVIDLWPRLEVPVYATPFTATLLKAKLAEYGRGLDIPIKVIEPGSRIDVGPFNVEFITVAHSIPEPNALAIRTPAGLVLHTGDWKLDPDPITGPPTDEKRLRELGDEGVDVLICDSTNVFRDGISPSEIEIAETIRGIIENAPARVAVTTFSSNVARMRSVAQAAHAAGRQLVVVGRAMHRMLTVAKETGHFPQEWRYLEQEDFRHLKRDQVVLLCTGSQGEPRAALARMSEKNHPHVELTSGDTVIFSSRTIPGNEKSVGAILNALAAQGMTVVTDSDAKVHVTGHPRREELKKMYAWTRPKVLIPMHGEMRHLRAHAQFAEENGIARSLLVGNGQMAVLDADAPRIIDEVPAGRLYRDGRLLLEAGDRSVRDRRKLSYVGLVAVSVVLSEKGEILIDPEVMLDGIPETGATGELIEDIVFDAVDGALESIPAKRRKDLDVIERAVARAARSAVDQAWGKRPICKVLISVV